MRIPVPCRAYVKIHPHPPLPKEGLFPLFSKEGAGEIFTGVVSFKQHIFQTESLCQTFLSLTGQTSGLPILSYTEWYPLKQHLQDIYQLC